MQRFIVAPGQSFQGIATVPGDKSISHRAVMLGAIARGTTTISGFLYGTDCLATVDAFRAMGVDIQLTGSDVLQVIGAGHGGLAASAKGLDLGNSGTSIRLLMGLLVGQRCAASLTGDASLRSRPMERIAEPLRAMGAHISTSDGCAPVNIQPVASLFGIDYKAPVASAQIKSALLLAALGAEGRTTIRSPGSSRDHTERMLSAMGARVVADADGKTVTLDGPCELSGRHIDVPGDLSSAAFLIVAAAIGGSGQVIIRGVGVNETRTGVLKILAAMGAKIERTNERLVGDEPVADLIVEQSTLRGVDIPPEWVPLAIDEFPAICIAAAAAEGRTVISGANELRHKETDRIAAMADALSAVGIVAQQAEDGLTIEGGRMTAGTIDSRADHRIAMAMSVAALISNGPIDILQTENVATSFPDFVATMRELGLEIEVERSRAA